MPASATRTGPPDFVGVGAQRAGTTWWFRTLLRHPQIRAPRHPDVAPGAEAPRHRKKELHFFDRFAADEMTDADVAAYHDLFVRADGQVVGEWTPRYMHDVWTPRLLARAAPEAKLLVLLRDPIERYRSGVAHGVIRAPARRRDLLAADAVERGRYATQLARLERFFDRERILVLQYERCRREPVAEYKRVLRFLGVDEGHDPVGVEQERGKRTSGHKDELWPDMLEALMPVLEPEVERLAAMVPELDVALWPHFAHLAERSATRG